MKAYLVEVGLEKEHSFFIKKRISITLAAIQFSRTLLDSIIITPESYYSFADDGVL